jgi:hypothetical protein
MHVSCISHKWFIYKHNPLLAQHIHNWHDMYKISVILEEHTPILLYPPSCLGIPPLFLGPLLTYLEIPPLAWCESHPLRSLVGYKLTFPPFLCSPFPFPLPLTVPHFNHVPSYDNITTSASHSPIQIV